MRDEKLEWRNVHTSHKMGCTTKDKTNQKNVVVYYESRKRELKIRLMNEGRCDERLKVRVEESTYFTYTYTTKQTRNTYR